MKLSIITTFYEGTKYLPAYIECIQANRRALAPGDELEVILINDSPWVQLQLPEDFDAKVVTMQANGGIHAARVRGLSEAAGEYVMFLDQDDALAEDAIAKHAEALRDRGDGWQGVQVSNAVLEQESWSSLWYRTAYHKSWVGDLGTYLSIGTQIISPGQCLIARSAIPQQWCSNLCQINGSDDYYLWLLLLGAGVPFAYLDNPLYIHRYTGANLSADTSKTDDSTFEFLQFLREDGDLSPSQCQRLETMVRFKASFRAASKLRKLALAAKHPILMLANLHFKLRTKTGYGFNR